MAEPERDDRGVAVSILRELTRDGVTWQARRSGDRGRLQLVAIVPPSPTPTVIEALSDTDIRALLSDDSPSASTSGWRCTECGADNTPDRRWCHACSSHLAHV
jgi:hypothetical protein